MTDATGVTEAPPTGESKRKNKDASATAYFRERQTHWNFVAKDFETRQDVGGAYHRRLEEVYRALVPPGRRVLELGCGTGDLLASLQSAVGVGIDFSPEMIARARARHPGLRFVEGDVHDLELSETFDVVIASDLLNDVWDVQTVLEATRPLCHARSRLIVNSYSRLWEGPLALAQTLKLSRPVLEQNWLTVDDLRDILSLSGFESLRSFQEILWPVPTPLLEDLANKVLVKLWLLRHLALTNFVVARPSPGPERTRGLSVSVVVPARNEAGNIQAILDRVPMMGEDTEIIFVEGHSTDGTFETIERSIAERKDKTCVLLRQEGSGKGDAVRAGFERARGDVLMILDADLTVPPEDLPRFFDALASGKGDFINGVRLVYPMEREAMRFFNLLGNKLFTFLFTYLLGQPIKDTLCGTKVLLRSEYENIAAGRAYFGDFDPFGDFDLLFGAARQGLKIVDLPIRYRQRTYGTTNIQRWRHGALLLRMAAIAARRIKFV
ncbi:MAG: glycosyltransferase [Thermoanaerobaculia bacterium]